MFGIHNYIFILLGGGSTSQVQNKLTSESESFSGPLQAPIIALILCYTDLLIIIKEGTSSNCPNLTLYHSQ